MSADLSIGGSHLPADADSPLGCLLARTAYVNDSITNGSTAECRMTDEYGNKTTIRVTFVVAHPPRVSYLCASCIGAEFNYEPIVLDTEGQFALLFMCIGGPRYYVYQPDGGVYGRPSLTLLPLPSGRRLMERDQIGLFLPPHHGPGRRRYLVAALFQALASPPGQLQFDLYLYDSMKRAWTVSPLLLPEDQQEEYIKRCHHTNKVITIGVTMAFVDPLQGILFCNVLDGLPALRYLPLPGPPRPSGIVCHYVSDVAFDANAKQFVFVDLHKNTSGWQAVIYTAATPATAEEEWTWSTGRPLNDLLELLPNGTDIDDLQRAYIEMPTLNVHDNTIHFLAKHSSWDRDGWVIAVDMAEHTLQSAAQYCPRVGNSMFRYSRISNHGCMAATAGNMPKSSLRKGPAGSYCIGVLKQLNYYGEYALWG